MYVYMLYMYTHMYTYIYIYMYIYICKYIYIYMRICVIACILHPYFKILQRLYLNSIFPPYFKIHLIEVGLAIS